MACPRFPRRSWRKLRGVARFGDRVRDDWGCPGGSAASMPPSRSRTGLRGARSRALPVGPRHSRRLPARGRRRLARAAPGRPPRRVLRGDSTGRPSVRCARRDAPGRPRGVRAIRGGHARPRWARARLGGRASWRSRPATAAAALADGGGDPGARAYAWTLGRRWAAAPRCDDYGLAWGPASVSSRPGWWSAGAPGARSCPDRSGRCPRRWPPTGGCDGPSTAAGSAARTAYGRDRAGSPRRARRATTTSARAHPDVT